ncbi:MAG: ATP-binding cassette domain-containing protein [Chitinispirillales bacterium]|jgi:ABC-type transporter Mla maintaining outer membrane lipid asymmetry ATPase subunit MlaF|nr:ATP-binding cassette domain-containing protein [Chitinispirillales bacterium]
MPFKIELRKISFARGQNTILDGVDLTVEPGHVVVFGGRSGSGKSALLEICAGHLKPAGGSVLWDGENVSAMSRYELYDWRKSIGYVFQVHALIANHSVFDNIALPLKCGTDLSGEQRKNKVLALMDELEIGHDIMTRFPETLPAAQLKSVAIARALINEPEVLLLDEPFSGVDPLTVNRLISVLHGKWKKGGMSIVMASHSLSAWPEWSAGRFVLKDGRLEPAGNAFATVKDLGGNQRYNQRYSYAK